MLFCINCGNGFTKSAERVRTKTIVIGYQCPQCHKTDELNVRFCVFCGHRLTSNSESGLFELSRIVPVEKRKTAAFASFERAVNEKNLQDLSAKVAIINYGSGFLLAVMLVVAIWVHVPQPEKVDFIVYTDPHKEAQLSLSPCIDATKSLPKGQCLVGRADSQGRFSFGNVAVLLPGAAHREGSADGEYKLQISAPNCRTAIATISVPLDRKVTVGSAAAPIKIPALDTK